jgi:hypothetical protein
MKEIKCYDVTMKWKRRRKGGKTRIRHIEKEFENDLLINLENSDMYVSPT